VRENFSKLEVEMGYSDEDTCFLKVLNSQLGKQAEHGKDSFLTGEKLTWIDIVVACELYQVYSSYQCDLPQHL